MELDDLEVSPINELRKECKRRSLPGRGTKAELQKRLRDEILRRTEAERLEAASATPFNLRSTKSPRESRDSIGHRELLPGLDRPQVGSSSPLKDSYHWDRSPGHVEGPAMRIRSRGQTTPPRSSEGHSPWKELVNDAHRIPLNRRGEGVQDDEPAPRRGRHTSAPPQASFGWKKIFFPCALILLVLLSLQKKTTPEADARLFAMDYLRNWATKNNLPDQWIQEIDLTRQHVEDCAARVPKVGTGLFLACKDLDHCQSVMDELQHHVSEQSASSMRCLFRLDPSALSGEGLEGQVQHGIVRVLKECERAIVMVDSAQKMPYKAAKVLTNALSEMGGFIDWGKHVPSTSGLYIMAVEVEGADVNMSPEQLVKVTKENFAEGLTVVGEQVQDGEALLNLTKVNAAALRRRLDWVLPIIPLQHKPT